MHAGQPEAAAEVARLNRENSELHAQLAALEERAEGERSHFKSESDRLQEVLSGLQQQLLKAKAEWAARGAELEAALEEERTRRSEAGIKAEELQTQLQVSFFGFHTDWW